MLEYIKTFAPETKINPDIIVEIFNMTNDLAEKISHEMKADEDPNVKAAEACISLLLIGKKPAVSPDDDHTIYMMLLGKVLKEAGKNLPEQIQKNIIDCYNTHKAYAGESQPKNTDSINSSQ
jgi:hypothetical protein